jgi:hypothetical protein
MDSDKKRVRELAAQVASFSGKSDATAELWKSHNKLQQKRPMVLVSPESLWDELLPSSKLICQDPLARDIEWKLRNRIFHYEHFHDDRVFENAFLVPKIMRYKSFLDEWFTTNTFHFHTGLCAPVAHSEMNPEAGFIPHSRVPEGPERAWGSSVLLSSLDDIKMWSLPEVEYLERASMEEWERCCDLIGDQLAVKQTGIVHISFHLASTYADLRGGLMNMLHDFYDSPQLIHAAMSHLSEGCLSLIKQYEELSLLTQNSGNVYHSSGGLSYSDELRNSPEQTRAADMWASAEAQELSEVSPSMYEEFLLPYEQEVLSPFGLNGYGCCEPLEEKLDSVFTLPNLRRISCSPFADLKAFAEKVKDRYVLSWKPNPALLSGQFNTAAIEEYIKQGLEAAKGCQLEIILKDLMTMEGEPDRIGRWLRIVNRLIGK